MSGISTSLTFPIDTELAPAVVRAIEAGSYSELERYVKNEECFYSSSRNNWLEFYLGALVRAFLFSDRLNHLVGNIDENGRQTRSLFVVSLGDDVLAGVICSLREFASELQSNPAKCGDIVGSTEQEVVDMLAVRPVSLAGAMERFRLYRSANEGEYFPTLAAFLLAHTSALELARSTSRSAIYAVWLY